MRLENANKRILRPLGPLEEFAFAVKQASPSSSTAFNISCAVRLKSTTHRLTPQVLQQAIELLAKRHPLLQASIEKVNGKFVFVSEESTLPSLETLEDVNWENVFEKGLHTPWKLSELLLKVYLIIHSDEETQDVVLWLHHVIADATSLYEMTTELLTYAVQLTEWGKAKQLEPSLLLRPISTYSPNKRVNWLNVLSKFRYYFKTPFSPTPISLPVDTNVDPGSIKASYHYDRLTPEETNVIIQKARKLGVTVGELVSAAMLLAIPENKSSQPTTVGFSYIVDLRRRANPPPPPDALGFCTMQIQTYYRVNESTKLSTLAREVQRQVKDTLDSGIQWDMGKLTKLAISLFERHLRRKGPVSFPYTNIFSNLGLLRLPPHIGSFTIMQANAVVNFCFCRKFIFLALGTFNQQMTFDWIYRGFVQEKMPEYFRRLRQVLMNSS